MSESHPTPPAKPVKPRPDFPLTPHRAGYWCKRIRGTLYYFGPRWTPGDAAAALAAADAAEEDYNRQAEALHAGKKPRESTEGTTIKDAVNAFLNHKKALREAGELSPRTWDEYKEATDLVIKHLGRGGRLVSDVGPDDFADLRTTMAKRWGPVRLGNVIQRVRSIFKHATEAGLTDRPVCFGPGFERPSAKVLRLHRAGQGVKLFSAVEVRRLVDAADVQLRAMFLLGINGGLGIADCGRLPLSAVNLDTGWVDFPRPKTGVARRFPLWPETVAAIRAALAMRREPKTPELAGLVFLTAQGRCWCKDDQSSPICFKVGQLLRKLGINSRKGLGFYTLRHTFRTVADEAKDQPAADYIMGHEVPHMSSVYRETISDTRLKAVTDHVHNWLFPSS